MTRMALMANMPTVAEQDRVTNLITASQASWWHWFPTAWIINDPTGRDITQWMEMLRTATPRVAFLIIDLDNPAKPPVGVMRPEWYDWIAQHWPTQ